MEPKILVAVDGSETSMKAVEHASRVLSGRKEKVVHHIKNHAVWIVE